MSDSAEIRGWRTGQTAEDFANLVKDSLGDQESGIVTVPFEDFTQPDHVVLLGCVELQGQKISYIELLGGALKYFHGLHANGYRAVPTDAPPTTPFSMALEITVSKAPNC